MLKKRFAVIKLWPQLKAAEHECIARLKAAAAKLDVECVEVDADARLPKPPRTFLSRHDVDFVLSLHYEQPKRFNIFSFVALWNPTQFYHEWGYRKFTEHLLTYDDFLSCSSTGADNHVRRRIAHDPTRAEPAFDLYHSVAEALYPPSLGDRKLVYAGINWERLGRKPGRHDELLKLLDKTGNLRIFGPKLFQNVDVWKGYRSYVGPLPFDGVSIVRQIHKAGIALVLSSAAHKESELMSNRLFESLAAGAVVIADGNPFARRFFGDSLLYIDTTAPAEEVAGQVESHLEWITENPEEALAMARQAQEIFSRDFTLTGSLARIYDGLDERKRQLASLLAPAADAGAITLFLLLPVFDPEDLLRLIESAQCQEGVTIDAVLCVDPEDWRLFRSRIEEAIRSAGIPITVREVEFYRKLGDGERQRLALGRVLNSLLDPAPRGEFTCFTGPNEILFSHHLASLQGAAQRKNEAGEPSAGAYCSMLRYADQDNGDRHTTLDLVLDWSGNAPENSIGIGRFLFLTRDLERSLGSALPYTDALAIHLLGASRPMAASGRSTLMIDVRHLFNESFAGCKPAEEREVIADYIAEMPVPARAAGFHSVSAWGSVAPAAIEDAIEKLPAEAKTKIVVQLAHSLPMPKLVSRMAFGVYRWWLRHLHDGKKPADRP